MGFTKYTSQAEKERARMNEGIRAPEVRVIGPDAENFGVLPIREALAKAQALGLDLIEISPNAQPPVCKITDYGKFKYEQKKKDKEAAWLKEGHRVKVDLFLWGRYKYMEFEFLKERLERFLAVIPEGYKVAEPIQKGPKGLSITLERDPSKKPQTPKPPKVAPPAPTEPEV